MTLLDDLFNGRRRKSRATLRVERLEVRRALAVDDGSDPWADPGAEDGGDAGDSAVDAAVVTDPSFEVMVVDCWLPPPDDTGDPDVDPSLGGGVFVAAAADGDGEPGSERFDLPQCWMPPPFGSDTEGGDGSSTDDGGSAWVGDDGAWDPAWTYRSGDGEPGATGDGFDTGDSESGDSESGDNTLDFGGVLYALGGPGHAPTGVVATPSTDGIVVTWQDAAAAPGGDIAFSNGYLVEMRRLRDASWSLAGTARDVTSLTVTGLDAGAHYVFRVTKTNVGLMQVLSSPSLPSRPVTTASAEGITVGLTDAGGARIAWDAVAGGGERVVEYRRLASAEWTRAGGFPGATGVATIDGLAGGRHYTFRILSPTGVYTPRSRAVTTPDKVDYLLGAVAGPSGAVVNWTDPSAATRTETVVEYRRLKDVAWLDLGSVVSTAGATKIDGLVPNANYVFRLRQRDANGQLSRTVATRPVTVSPDCVFPPACVDYPAPAPSGTLLLVNPSQGQSGTVIAGAPAEDGTGEALVATGTLSGTGTLVGRDEQPQYFLSGAGDDPTA
jgi:hypothetical protein